MSAPEPSPEPAAGFPRDARTSGHVVVLGLMGVGKSTIGRMVADRLGLAFIDNDDLLAARTGRAADQIAAANGLDELHRIEADVLAEAIERPSPSVLAAAGSVVTDEAARQALRKARHVVWLRDDLTAITARIVGSGQLHRPGFSAQKLRQVERERRPLFAAAATVTVDVAGDPPEIVADRIVAMLGR
jgi:shikimate kinase